MKYETARSIRFQIKLFAVTSILSAIAAPVATWHYIARSVDDESWLNFSVWIQSWVKCMFLPNMLEMYQRAATYLHKVELMPQYHAQFFSWGETIFMRAPLYGVGINVGLWILIAAIMWRIKKNKGATK